MTDAYTTTLLTGQTLAITPSADFGETIINSLLLSLLVTLALGLILKVAYERNR
jgi:hypothetical protein